MIKQTLEISQRPVKLSVRMGQLVVKPTGDETEETRTFHCEDIGLVLLEHPSTLMTLGSLQALLEKDAAIIVCGRDHLPLGLLLPYSDNHKQIQRIHEQIGASKPTKKRIWKQIVSAKIRAQARNLERHPKAEEILRAMLRRVKSGDPDNVEAQAARAYWSEMFDREYENGFRRTPRSVDDLNSFLDYGYAIVRAAVARALVCAGFNPALGVHHAGRANGFCLADDLMEPLRPAVDCCARNLLLGIKAGRHEKGLCSTNKAAFLNLLVAKAETGGEVGPLSVGLTRYVASFGRVLRGESVALEIPKVLRC